MNSLESRRIQNILASISDCFYALDAQWRLVYLNPQAEAFFGRNPEELIGRSFWEVFPEAKDTIFEREYRRVLENGGRLCFEGFWAGAGRTLETTVYAQSQDPVFAECQNGLVVYFRDVTGTRQAQREQRHNADYHRLLVENAREYAIIGMDLEGRITYWNEGARRIFGWNEEEVIGRSGDLFFTPEDIHNEIPVKERAEAMRTGRGNDERIHLRKDGARFWALGDMMAVYESDGQPRGFVKILRDNTERRLAEDEYRRVQKTLRDTETWLRKVTDHVGVAFWIWEPARDEITYQKSLDTMMGVRFESFAEFESLCHPGDLEKVNETVKTALALRQDYEMEFRVKRHLDARADATNDWKWVLAIVSVQTGEQGQTICFGINLDITSRKQTQLQYEQSQRRLQDIAGNARAAIWVWDPIRDIVHEKFMLDELFGFEVKDFESFSHVLHPDDIAPTMECAHRVLRERSNGEVTYRLPGVKHPHPGVVEDWRWFLCKMAPGLRAQNSQIIHGLTIDITEQRVAQEEVARSARLYSTLAEATQTSVWRGRPDLSDLDLTSWGDLTGQTPEEYQNGGWANAIHPADREKVFEAWRQALEEKKGFEITYLLRHADGKYRFNTGTAIPVFDAGGELREWIGTNVNTDEKITAQIALRESERRYRALIDAAPQIVWESAPNGTMLYGNEFWLRYCGLQLPEILGEAWKKCIHPEDLPLMEIDWDRARQQKFLYEREVRLWCAPRKEWRWHLTRALPILSERGEIEKWIGVAIEIHERRLADELREQLLQEEQKARKNAEIASRQKDEFLAIVSHELRTPLNAILGWSNLLRTGELPPTTQLEGLQVIERNARAQAQIVDDILDVARVIAGKLKVEKRTFDFGQLARETLDSLVPNANTRGVKLEGEYEKLAVTGDPIRLRQVLWNLLSNALKFTPTGGQVRLSMAAENEQAVVKISDSGTGIAPEFLPHVFDRFRQADSSSTRRHGGLGLGLALVSSIVEAHGGQVGAASPGVGQGATFTVRLPLAGTSAPVAPEKSAPTGQRLRGRSLLVVDDAPDTLALTQILLRREGASVEVAESVRQAQQKLLAQTFDLVVSDLAMPDADGYELLEWLRNRESRVPVVAVTAFASGEEERRVKAAGFDGFVPKPIDADRLMKALLASLEPEKLELP